MQARGTFGEHTATVGGVFDLSNKRRLGLTELDAVSQMAVGVKELLSLEALMQAYNANMPGMLYFANQLHVHGQHLNQNKYLVDRH